MPTPNKVKPSHKAIQAYYTALEAYARQEVEHEAAVSTAFHNLLDQIGRHYGWTLIPQLPDTADGISIRPDGTFRDDFYITRGHWEAKDTRDNLEVEIRKKIAKDYPLTNIIFEDTRQAFLYQSGQLAMKVDLTEPQQLADLLAAFFSYTEPAHEDFGKAIGEFKERVPELARGLVEKIQAAHLENPRFIAAFEKFYDLCKRSLNPNLSVAAVDEMLVQHLLTERLIRTIFDNQDFTRRNVIAAEVEKVVDALVSKAFNRHDFLKSLDRFYLAIESAAETIRSFPEKQHFLNTIYERFFQGYSVRVADTHGIVYTPQEIVDFMCAQRRGSFAERVRKTLGDEGVHILDPCTGTGNFVVNLLQRIPKRELPRAFNRQLFANEVMLLPYYIAALNIEHAYYERTGGYEPFPGLCFVDTLDLAKGQQGTFGFMTEENVAQVEREREAPITVVIGNPPYNAWQLNENDNNKNRKYEVIDRRVSETYARDSKASNKNALSDMYVKFFRWAVDRLNGRDGIVCFVSNNGFLSGVAADGFRKHMWEDFQRIYHFDLKGNARTSADRRRREGGNIFSDKIRVGVGISVLVRNKRARKRRLFYYAVPDYWRAEQKRIHLASFRNLSHVKWLMLAPDTHGVWLAPANGKEFISLVPLGCRETKRLREGDPESVFGTYSIGVKTNRDEVVYDFAHAALADRVREFVEDYSAEVDRYKRVRGKVNLDDFVRYEKIKWSRDLKKDLQRGVELEFAKEKVRTAIFRPFSKRYLYFDRVLNEEVYGMPRLFPRGGDPNENLIIAVSDIGYRAGTFSSLASNCLVDIHLCAGVDSHQCFPFYVYDDSGDSRRENITDWALKHFREHYKTKKIAKWDIFYYIYGLLHHPGYRYRYAENLKRELPRISLAPDFKAFAEAGKRLAKLHLEYETLEPYPLEWIETPGVPLSYRVEKMRLVKDRRSLKVNDSLTLAGIPPEVFDYRMGNRSALEWVIDQYRVRENSRSGIRSDPNRPDDEQYIVRLVGQLVQVSLETVRIVQSLPEDFAMSPGAQVDKPVYDPKAIP